MTAQELPTRQKSQRVLKRLKSQKKLQYFQQFKQEAKNINNINELLPGLNDISDAFEAMPMDLIKYFTLLKEIDAKYINIVPVVNGQIKDYIERLHSDKENAKMRRETKIKKLSFIRDKLHEIVPCLEEKMHVTSIASDLMYKHLFRIDNDYKLIINNNEIPESVRIGPLNHPAMIMESGSGENGTNSAQSQRSESRREALAAKKANRDHHTEDPEEPKKKRNNATKESANSGSETGSTTRLSGNSKKRSRNDTEDNSRLGTPGAPPQVTSKKRPTTRPKREEKDGSAAAEFPSNTSSAPNEPTYCYCNQVSFGEMVGCDGEDCKREWFHLPCIGFKNPPKGKWYCDDCLIKMKKIK